MAMLKSKLACGAAFATLLLTCGSAEAAVTWVSIGLDGPPAPGETMVLDFDGIAHPGFVLTGGAESSATIPGVAAAPAGDPTDFYYVVGGGTATLAAPSLLNTLSLYIGSLNVENTIEFKRGGVSVGSFNGLQLQLPANGDENSASTNRRFYFDFGADGVDEVVFSSSAHAFEFDNIAVSSESAIPEPGVWALLIAGFGITGTALRHRRRESFHQ